MGNLDALKSKLKKLIPKESIDSIIEKLKELFPEKTEKHADILLIESRQNDIDKKRLRGVSSDAELQIAYNKIREDLILFIENIEAKDFEPPRTKKPKKNTLLIAIAIVVVMSAFSIFYLFKSIQEKEQSSTENDLPDLIICNVDIENDRIDICNIGSVAVSPEELYLAWSEGWYDKPEWNSAILIGALSYMDSILIKPGQKLPIFFEGLGEVDKTTEFMIDPNDAIKELDETNNCSDIHSRRIPCRPDMEWEE